MMKWRILAVTEHQCDVRIVSFRAKGGFFVAVGATITMMVSSQNAKPPDPAEPPNGATKPAKPLTADQSGSPGPDSCYKTIHD
ncbi:hypothetical protein N7468_002309 [Penicillium chermesinum]|uniref:Uncharacterized protein n=1 Tax=Penicillium chermesinum TaxID=63820 RepID=A0A9W9TXE4_9EURO|nr:uncharacterized protein N7468_002309 [Penicillium chermesinum]KAJ5247326.1 hypothetical protein N7468_002309 [Penicillium chermesinum]